MALLSSMEQVYPPRIFMIGSPLADFFKVKCIKAVFIKTCYKLFQSQVPTYTVHGIVKSIPKDKAAAANLHQAGGLAPIRALALEKRFRYPVSS